MEEVYKTDILEQNSEMEGKYLTFLSGGQLLGVPICDVVQIVGIQGITEIPEYPYYAKGVINLRGTVIPIIDVRLRLNKPEAEYTDRTCIIVTSIHDRNFGFVVDEVDEVTAIDADTISPPPEVNGTESQYMTGITTLNGKITLLINTAKLLGADEFASLMNNAG